MIHEIALTIKPTMSCNMKCKHCFNGDTLNQADMIDMNSVYYFIEAACKEYSDIKVTFHGGEPTLAGIDFYKDIYAFQKAMNIKYGVTFSNNFTTNGLSLSDELIELLVSNDVLINISFDGPYNDLLRSHSLRVYKNILKVKNKGGRMRAFCTIAKGSFKYLQEIYDWFNKELIDFKILPIEPRGYAATDSNLLMDLEPFVNTLATVYTYWATDQNCRIRVYTFEEFAALRRDIQFKPFWFNREIALNPDGKVYPFGRPNDIQFCLGSPTESFVLNKCFESSQYNRMLDVLSNYRNRYCNTCSATMVCNGVCICMSYMYVKQPELLEYSCRQSRHIFERILEINDSILADFTCGNIHKYNKTIKAKFSKGVF